MAPGRSWRMQPPPRAAHMPAPSQAAPRFSNYPGAVAKQKRQHGEQTSDRTAPPGSHQLLMTATVLQVTLGVGGALAAVHFHVLGALPFIYDRAELICLMPGAVVRRAAGWPPPPLARVR